MRRSTMQQMGRSGGEKETDGGGVGEEEGLFTDGTAVNAHNMPASAKRIWTPISPMRCQYARLMEPNREPLSPSSTQPSCSKTRLYYRT